MAEDVCDWCGDLAIITVSSSAGKRCAECEEKPLCKWCGEAEGLECPHDAPYCEQCCAKEHGYEEDFPWT